MGAVAGGSPDPEDDFADALITIDQGGRVLSWGGGATRLFGWGAAEAQGRALSELVLPPERGAGEEQAWATALAQGGLIREATRRRKDGSTLLVDATVRAVLAPDGALLRLAIVERDVTRLRCLREAEVLDARYRGLLEAAPDAMVIVNASGRIALVNDQALRLFGYVRAELLGEPVEALVPERFRPQHPAQRDAFLAAPHQRPMGAGRDLAARRRDGSEFPAEISLSPVRTEEGRTLVAAAIRDVSARRRVEARFRGLLEAAPDAMVIVDRAGRIVLVNGQTERLFGWSREELIGQPVELLVPERLRALHPGRRDAYFAEPRLRPMGEGAELAGRRKDGSEFPAEISLGPVETEDELLVTAAIRDVSERKRLEQLRAEEREEQHRRIRQASRLKSEFLANMSHELRTPLNAIIGFAKLMHTGVVGEVSPPHKEYLGDILTSAGHLLQLINDVLDLSKVEAGKLELHPCPVDLDRLVGETIETVRSLAVQKQLRIEREVAPEVRQVVVDPSRLKQVLYNYLSNALKFTGDGGQVWVRVRPEGPERFRLEVEDTGVGIAASDLERLFVEFQQLDAGAAKRHQGTGLGLALTRRLVLALGGEVGVTSHPGRGSTFFALLPRAARGPAPAPVDLAATAPAGEGRAGAGPAVLVVEDDPRDRGWAVRTLRQAGYAVVAVSGSAAAQELARERPFQAIVLDLLLPDGVGWDVLWAIRAVGPNRTTPVIVTTVVGEASAAFPVHDYLHKPLRASELLESLQRAGVVPEGRPQVLVLDEDPAAAALAAAAVEQAGFCAVCRTDGEAAARDLEQAPPAALVLGRGGLGRDWLLRLRAGGLPVIVWTGGGAAARAPRGDGPRDPRALLRALRALLPTGSRPEPDP